jgi:opacity protein-like surface antigen
MFEKVRATHYILLYIQQGRTSMKRIFILLMSLLFAASAGGACADVAVKGSFDFSGTAKYGSSETDTGSGFDLSVEYFGTVAKIVQLGGGVEYQFLRSSGEGGEFGFLPIYGAVRVVIPVPAVKPYALGRIGYNLFRGDSAFKDDGSGGQADLKGGLAYGIGGGIIFLKYVLIEGQYSVNQGKLDYASIPDKDFTYSRFQLSAGVNFSF